MMTISFCILLWTSPQTILPSMISASSSALSLSLELCGIYVVWIGILELVDASGLGEKIAKLLRPFIKKIFKTKDEETEKYIALNMSSNMLGLGNASTPMGIKALQKLDDGSGTASVGAIMLIIINATSIQLLPTTVIGLRTSLGSSNPSDIIIPSLIATFCTFCLGIILGKICEKIYQKIKK